MTQKGNEGPIAVNEQATTKKEQRKAGLQRKWERAHSRQKWWHRRTKGRAEVRNAHNVHEIPERQRMQRPASRMKAKGTTMQSQTCEWHHGNKSRRDA
jgi:hypothetical protein